MVNIARGGLIPSGVVFAPHDMVRGPVTHLLKDTPRKRIKQEWIKVAEELGLLTGKETLSQSLDSEFDVMTRESAWKSLARELELDESMVAINKEGIYIEGVGGFELNDDEGLHTFDCMKHNPNIPSIDMWTAFLNFMKEWEHRQIIFFLTKVMNLDVTRLTNDANYYWSSSQLDENHGNTLGILYGIPGIALGTFGSECAVRRCKNNQTN